MLFVSLEYLITVVVILITVLISIKYYTKQKIVIVSNTTSCIKAINDLKKLNPYILGLDCEWVGKHKISLLQLGHPKLIILIRMHKLETIPIELIGLMNNNKILKTGVGIYNDIKRLRNDYSINVNGVIDINDILPKIDKFTELLNNYYPDTPAIFTCQQTFGLNRLSQILLGKQMKYKSKKIATSNWEINSLSQKQILYAADDAIVGWKLFKKCMELQNISHDIHKYLSFCFGRIDIPFSTKPKPIPIPILKPDNNEKISEKNKRKYMHEKNHRTTLFDNCQLLKPNGDLFIGCSRKSMDWYLRKEYADIVDDNTAKLKLEPQIQNEKSLKYFQTGQLTNKCFVCGKKGALCKFHIVPNQYRNYMDIKYKSKALRLHDHIPLCRFCHHVAVKTQNILIQELCEKYSDTLPYYKIRKGDKQYTLLCQAQRASRALQQNNKNIPIKTKIEKLEILCNYFGLKYSVIYIENDEMKNIDNNYGVYDLIKIEGDYGNTVDVIDECMSKLEIKMEEKSSKSLWELHAKAMLEIYKDKQAEFIKMWRQHFKDNMKPRYLPDIWSVDTSNMLDH